MTPNGQLIGGLGSGQPAADDVDLIARAHGRKISLRDVPRRRNVEAAPRWRVTTCEIAGRPADVGTPLQKNGFATVIRWNDAMRNEALAAVVRRRTLDELRTLRAVLFTLRFPDA